MKLKVIIITLFITVPLLVNAKWVDLVCTPNEINWHFFDPILADKSFKKCTSEYTDNLDKDLSEQCLTLYINFNSDSDSATVSGNILKESKYSLKRKTEWYELEGGFEGGTLISINRQSLKYGREDSFAWGESNIYAIYTINIGFCELVDNSKNLI
jgi:hypothetical protein